MDWLTNRREGVRNDALHRLFCLTRNFVLRPYTALRYADRWTLNTVASVDPPAATVDGPNPECGMGTVTNNVSDILGKIGDSIKTTILGRPGDPGVDVISGAEEFIDAVKKCCGGGPTTIYAACKVACAVLPQNATVTKAVAYAQFKPPTPVAGGQNPLESGGEKRGALLQMPGAIAAQGLHHWIR